MRELIEAENEAKAEIQKAMSRALAEAQIWKSKYSTEACARIEDLENARAKLLVIYLSQTHRNFEDSALSLVSPFKGCKNVFFVHFFFLFCLGSNLRGRRMY